MSSNKNTAVFRRAAMVQLTDSDSLTKNWKVLPAEWNLQTWLRMSGTENAKLMESVTRLTIVLTFLRMGSDLELVLVTRPYNYVYS